MARKGGSDRSREGVRNRGVRVAPLPKYMHREFIRLCTQLRVHAQSHYATWRQALHYSQHDTVRSHAYYWRSVLGYLNTLEYLGTHGDEPGTTPRESRSGTDRP